MDKKWLLLGIAVLLTGLAITVWHFALALALITAGTGFSALGLLLSSERTPTQPFKQQESGEEKPEKTDLPLLPFEQEENFPLKKKTQTQTKIKHKPPTSTPPDTVKQDPAARLARFKELLDKKLISEEDYKRKKMEILSQV